MLIQQADIYGTLRDVRLAHGRIEKIASHLSPHYNEPVFQAHGGSLLAGLHDHHIHLNATAAAFDSVRFDRADITSADDMLKKLHRAARETKPDEEIRAIGYHESLAGDIDCAWLDEFAPARPIRIQHRSGRLWIFNSAAKKQAGCDVPDNGRLYDGDLMLRHNAKGNTRPSLHRLVQHLLSFGITGVTDVTPHNNSDDYEHLEQNAPPLKITIMGRAELAQHQPRTQHNKGHIGQVKFHYHDHDLPPLAALVAEIRHAHKSGRGIAAHCVTHAELFLTLAALEEAGVTPHDRIEHAALVNEEALQWLARLNLSVVTQPHFITERKQAYLAEIEAREHPFLWRLNTLHEAGLPLAAGSDAPFGRLNPWASIKAACLRPTEFNQMGEAMRPAQALRLFQKDAQDITRTRQVAEGEMADLCLIAQSWAKICDMGKADDVALAEALANINVRASFIDGALAYTAPSSHLSSSEATMSSTSPHS